MLERLVDAVRSLVRPALLLGTAGAALYFFATGNEVGGVAAIGMLGPEAGMWFEQRGTIRRG